MQAIKSVSEREKTVDFLKSIGIEVNEKALGETFLPGVELTPKGINVDYSKLLYPGDLLHEAGHWAVATAQTRELIGTDAINDWPSQGDEMAAILWSYAALLHLQLPADFVFHPNGYKNASKWYIDSFAGKNYIGLPLLEWMGLTLSDNRAVEEGKQAFPVMQKWLRD